MIRYLETFFEEKQLPFVSWELRDADNQLHFIDSDVVLEHIVIAPKHEQEAIANMIRRIDFIDGDVNKYLKHLAEALINDK